MTHARKTLTLHLTRVIAGSPAKVFKAWLDPRQPCNPWSVGDSKSFKPEVGKLFCILCDGEAYIFGRVLHVVKAKEFKHTWMSRYTHGMETTVTAHFTHHDAGTLMRLRHSGLSNDRDGRDHVKGWSQFLDRIEAHFAPQDRVPSRSKGR